MLSQEALSRVDRELAKFPPDQRRSAVIAALAIAQEEQGHLSTEVMDFVARHLGMPPVAVYEVASFYTMFDREPVGTHKLCVCTNLPCALRGAVEALEHLKRRLGIEVNQTTPDGKFTLREGECFGACGDAPVVIRNNKEMLSFMTPERIDRLLAELAK
ncbi:MAG: NADH-quinone oxidoreductase subunit NuoE [Burkholderiales bacterium]|nr:NADH-quinone oxidoreductase subunit NuoE [Burkholderiales bacterium]